MRARTLTAAVVVVLLGGALAADAAPPVDRQLIQALRLIALDATPPPLALARVADGRTVTLRDFQGRPVLLYFWASW